MSMAGMRVWLPLFFLFTVGGLVNAQVNNPPAYDIGSPVLQDIWVDPVAGLDSRTGLTRGQAVRSVTEAWSRIPQGSPLATTGYRIRLVAGHHTDVPLYWEQRRGTFARPVIIESADGPGAARIDTMNIYACSYLYLIGLRLEAGGGDVLHIDSCDHFLLRNAQVVGTGDIWAYDSPQEAFKGNQSQYVYIEGCDISGGFDNGVDFVAVQYGHAISNRIHRAVDWCMYLKGGSACFTVAGNEFFDGGTGGFTAGQGTGFEYMTSPWLHYEAYDIKFINNVVHDTGVVGVGVNGGYNILIAHNTLYRAGVNDHVFEVVHGSRSCDGQTATCNANNGAGGWGGAGLDGQYIPSRNVYIYNNLVYNPGNGSDWSHFVINGATTPPGGSNVANPSHADQNVRVRGNLIWNGDARVALNGGTGCGAGNGTCNDTQLAADNTVNVFEPQLVAPGSGDYRPVEGGNVFLAATYAIPSFPGGDRASPPLAPQGNLDNTVPVDRAGTSRSGGSVPGAYAGPANPPPTVAIVDPANNAVFVAPTTIVVSVSATDETAVIEVLLYDNGQVVGSDTVAPYAFAWSPSGLGYHQLQAEARDASGSAVSSEVRVRIRGTNEAAADLDLDGDGVSDLAVYWLATGQWYVQRSTDLGLTQLAWGWADARPAPGDYDGDGRCDVAVYHQAAGDWYIRNSADSRLTQQNWGWAEAMAVPGDYDGDGRCDLAVYAQAMGTWYVLRSTDGQLQAQAWGWAEAQPVPADYDGDGKTDFAVYHRAAGTWYIRESQGGTFRQQNWGWSAAEPVPADYDGDGRADPAVYHQAAGDWYVLRSATFDLLRVNWGWVEADPVPADYDGDGLDDLAVYHQALGNWYILQSGTYALRLQNWGWPAAYPAANGYWLDTTPP
jgi:hypothetical protein